MSGERLGEHSLLTASLEDPDRRPYNSLSFHDITLSQQRTRACLVNLSDRSDVSKCYENLTSSIEVFVSVLVAPNREVQIAEITLYASDIAIISSLLKVIT